MPSREHAVSLGKNSGSDSGTGHYGSLASQLVYLVSSRPEEEKRKNQANQKSHKQTKTELDSAWGITFRVVLCPPNSPGLSPNLGSVPPQYWVDSNFLYVSFNICMFFFFPLLGRSWWNYRPHPWNTFERGKRIPWCPWHARKSFLHASSLPLGGLQHHNPFLSHLTVGPSRSARTPGTCWSSRIYRTTSKFRW